MRIDLPPFVIHWGITAGSLWVVSCLLPGFKFTTARSLIFSALLLGFANAIVKPIIFWLTIPLTMLTFGAFLLVINACMILLVSTLVRGFEVSSFWTACIASIFISGVRFLLDWFVIGRPISWWSMHHMYWL